MPTPHTALKAAWVCLTVSALAWLSYTPEVASQCDETVLEEGDDSNCDQDCSYQCPPGAYKESHPRRRFFYKPRDQARSKVWRTSQTLGDSKGAPWWRVRRRAGARASRSGRAGRPESSARCRVGACRPPWPTLWRQAALAAGGPSSPREACAATSTGAENGFLRVCYTPSYAATAARHRRYAADR